MTFWRRKRPVSPSPEAQATLNQAIAMKAKQQVHAEQWEHHLHSNGFAELIEALFIQSASGRRKED